LAGVVIERREGTALAEGEGAAPTVAGCPNQPLSPPARATTISHLCILRSLTPDSFKQLFSMHILHLAFALESRVPFGEYNHGT
jgi:hypothetical protein